MPDSAAASFDPAAAPLVDAAWRAHALADRRWPQLEAVGAVHVWWYALDAPPETLLPLLDDSEAARARRFVFARDRDRHVVAHARLRQIIARYAATTPEALSFTVDGHGKPSLAAPDVARSLSFNLAHSGAEALVALTRAAAIGVDLERHRPLPERDALAASHFAAAEREAMAAIADDAARDLAFHAIWTRKEAWVKATGAGLSTPLDAFEVTHAAGDPQALRSIAGDAAAARAWTLADLPGLEGASAAVALPHRGVAISCFRLVEARS